MNITDVEPLAPVISSRHELLIKHVDRYMQVRSSLRKSTGELIMKIACTFVEFDLIMFIRYMYDYFCIKGILPKEVREHIKYLLSLELNDSQNATLTLIQDIFIPSIGIYKTCISYLLHCYII